MFSASAAWRFKLQDTLSSAIRQLSPSPLGRGVWGEGPDTWGTLFALPRPASGRGGTKPSKLPLLALSIYSCGRCSARARPGDSSYRTRCQVQFVSQVPLPWGEGFGVRARTHRGTLFALPRPASGRGGTKPSKLPLFALSFNSCARCSARARHGLSRWRVFPCALTPWPPLPWGEGEQIPQTHRYSHCRFTVARDVQRERGLAIQATGHVVKCNSSAKPLSPGERGLG